jgi:CHAT domain-containing protein/tetratricopeptide (TPR) repeat protein
VLLAISLLPAAGGRDAVLEALAEGRRLLADGRAESAGRAREQLERSAAAARELGDRELETDALLTLGEAQAALDDYSGAGRSYDAALALASAARDKPRTARAWHLLGVVRYGRGELPASREALERALTLWRELSDRAGEIETQIELGVVLRAAGGNQQAGVRHAEQALALAERLGNAELRAKARSALAVAYYDDWRMQEALDILLELLPTLHTEGRRVREAELLSYVGGIYAWMGDEARALDHFDQSLRLQRELGSRRTEAQVLNDLGVVEQNAGRSEKSIEYLENARSIQQQIGNRRGEAMSLINLARSYDRLKRPQEALGALEQALLLTRRIEDRRNEAAALDGLGRYWQLHGDVTKAVTYYEQALPAVRAAADRMREAAVLSKMGQAQRDLGHLAEARTAYESSVALLDDLRAAVRGRDLRAAFTASFRTANEGQLGALMALHAAQPAAGHDGEAFRASERFRARGLLELLVLSGGNAAATEIVESERTAQQRLASSLERQVKLETAGREREAAALAREIRALQAELDNARGLRETQSRRRAALLAPVTVTLAEVQRELLDPNTVLLEYFLGRDGSYFWAVTSTGLASYRLPPRAEIEPLARRAHEGLASTRGAPPAELAAALSSLSRMLLAPAAEAIRGRRVVVAADGGLEYLPFAVLPDPGDPGQPLIARHEVVAVPSASIVRVLRREAARRPARRRTLAVLADPVFATDDERVQRRGADPGARPLDTTTASAVREAGLESGIPRLPFTRREAQAILALMPRGEGRAALDFDASRATALDAALGEYRFLHFATHGFLNASHPELSGLLLSLADRQGHEQAGFLSATEIFDLRLTADLVVLSGCQTALGKEVSGEGLVGMTRAFLYAGASRVLASLWRVHDAATAELMTTLYRGLLKDGLTPAAALRGAQLAMLRHPGRDSPYYWAGFQLYGEWR